MASLTFYIFSDIIKEALVEKCTVNGRPLVSVNDSGFRKILNPVLDALPTPLAVSPEIVCRWIDEKADSVRNNIAQELKGRIIPLKMDICSRKGKSYLGVNTQFFKNKVLELRNLAVIELLEEHTASYINRCTLEVLKRYQVDPRNVYSITVDNGPNVVAAIRYLRYAQEDVAVEALMDGLEACDDMESFSDLCRLNEGMS